MMSAENTLTPKLSAISCASLSIRTSKARITAYLNNATNTWCLAKH